MGEYAALRRLHDRRDAGDSTQVDSALLVDPSYGSNNVGHVNVGALKHAFGHAKLGGMNPIQLGLVNAREPVSCGLSNRTSHTGTWHSASWTLQLPGVTTHGGTIGHGPQS